MKRIEFKSPVLRKQELPYVEFAYPVLSRKYLPEPTAANPASFFEVLDSRTSRRTFNKLSFDKINAFLWHSARAVYVAPPEISIRWQHRPSPSGGGRHPVDVLILNNENGHYLLSLYQPISHSLSLLRGSKNHIDDLIKAIEAVLPTGDATIIWMAAQFDRTLSRYENGESIVWRDAGALIATMMLVAESLKINCCPVGITGDPYIAEMFDDKGYLAGVGGLLIG